MGITFVYQAFAAHASCFPHPNLPTCHAVLLNDVMQCTQIRLLDTTVYLHTAANNALRFCLDNTCRTACTTFEDDWRVAAAKCTLYPELELTYGLVDAADAGTMHNKECIHSHAGEIPPRNLDFVNTFSVAGGKFAWPVTVIIVVCMLLFLIFAATTYAEGLHSVVIQKYQHHFNI